MKKLWKCLLISCLYLPVLAQSNFQQGIRSVEIPFRYENNFIVVRVNFNRSFPLKFIFDTGAEHSILTKREFADILGIPSRKRFSLVGADLQTIIFANLITGIHLEVENVVFRNQNMLVLEEDYFQFETLTGLNIHGILGADIFRHYIVEINYRTNRIKLTWPNYFKKPPARYYPVPIEVSKNKPYLHTSVVMGTGDTIGVKLLIDTGASLSLLLNTDTHPDLQKPEKTIVGNIGTGLGGFLEGFLGRIPLLHMGEYELDNIITNFQDLSEVADTSYFNGRNGIIGNVILSRFNLIIDYPREIMYLRANRGYKRKFKYDRSGMLLIAAGARLNKFVVQKVLPNSPAEEAGMQQGDVIERINLLPTSVLSLDDMVRILQARVGKKIRLRIVRDGEKLRKQFRLRDLI